MLLLEVQGGLEGNRGGGDLTLLAQKERRNFLISVRGGKRKREKAPRPFSLEKGKGKWTSPFLWKGRPNSWGKNKYLQELKGKKKGKNEKTCKANCYHTF